VPATQRLVGLTETRPGVEIGRWDGNGRERRPLFDGVDIESVTRGDSGPLAASSYWGRNGRNWRNSWGFGRNTGGSVTPDTPVNGEERPGKTRVHVLATVLGHADRVEPLRDNCVGLLLPVECKSVEPIN
jgi:hypothetical protein